MTNKYKFRGKSLKTGEWVYGSLLQINDDSYVYPYKTGDLDDIDFGCGFVKVSKESVGQFTGLKDKNDVEIYEGDLLHNPHDRNYCYPVEWNEVQAGFTLGGDMANMKPYAVSTFWEVIGNIIDNIELISCNEQ